MAKATKKPTWRVPFDSKTGNMLSGKWDSRRWNYSTNKYEDNTDVIYVDNDYTFEATLEIMSSYGGGSTEHYSLSDVDTHACYVMFSGEFMEMLKASTIYNGVVRAKWGFAKKGTSICLTFQGNPTTTTDKE